jgi:hypothetical protein
MAVGHYQFEAIHPFEDGNGRTGRILNLLFLVEQGLLQTPVLYMSQAIIRTKSEYYQLLLEVSTQQRWEPWVLYMLRVVAETSRGTTAKIRAIRRLFKTVAEQVQHQAPKIYSRELVELICEQPYCRIENVVQAGIAKRQTASVYLAALADIGILRPIPGGREKLFLHSALMELLGADGEGPTSGNASTATADRPQIDVTPELRKRSKGVNRSSAIDEQLRFAIANKLLIQVSYNGSTRVMEPHDYGLLKGSQKLLAYQLRRSGGGPRKALTGWRLLDVAKIDSCLVLEEPFPGSRGASHLHHLAWDFVNARVSG